MWAILWWFVCITLIGWLSFPLTAYIFRHLPGRGFAFSRPLGLLIWGVFHWLLTSWGILNNNLLSQSVALGVMLLFSLYLAGKWGFDSIRCWFTENLRMVLSVELVFSVGFIAFSIFRSTSPAIIGTEKPMELAFLNAVLRSKEFPPHDPWLSGYSISYYYLGYVLVALLTRLTGVISTAAFNLAQALWFAMVAAGAYGLLVDLFALWKNKKLGCKTQIKDWMLRWALLAPVMILLLGNAYGFLDVLHARGVFWHEESGSVVSSFWRWLDLRGLNDPPAMPYRWEQNRSGSVSWWNASRVVEDMDYAGESVEIIDEFPNFSFVLGDLHPHLLAMPFVLLSIGLALDYFNETEETGFSIGKMMLPVNPTRYLTASSLIGALAVLNTWDLPIYVGLYSAVFLIHRVKSEGWRFFRLFEFLLHGLGMALVGMVVYLPFFMNFSSQAGGFLPSLIYFTRGVHFWVMFFPLIIPLSLYLFYLFHRIGGVQKLANAGALFGSLVVFLVLINIAYSYLAVRLGSLGELFMANQGASQVSLTQLLQEALLRRLSSPGTWLTLGGLLIVCLSIILVLIRKSGLQADSTQLFIVLLVLWGCLLTLLPEFVYLLDSFGKRMNTIFKFYYQSWILWSLAGAFGIGVLRQQAKPIKHQPSKLFIPVFIALSILVLAVSAAALSLGGAKFILPEFGAYILDGLWGLWFGVLLTVVITFLLRRRWFWVFRMIVIAGLTVGAVYPVSAVNVRSNGFRHPDSWTLDGGDYYRERNPYLMAAVDWLWTLEPAVIAEAIAPDGGDYSQYGRVSMLTGFPAVLGWCFHEIQWRGGDAEIGSRQADIALLYETLDWDEAQRVIDKYNIEYIYIGDLERDTYVLREEKFYQHTNIAFQEGDVIIFRPE